MDCPYLILNKQNNITHECYWVSYDACRCKYCESDCESVCNCDGCDVTDKLVDELSDISNAGGGITMQKYRKIKELEDELLLKKTMELRN